MNIKQLRYTGERMHNKPGSTDYLVNLARYKFSTKLVKNKKVLDISCGIGHGSEYLARYAKKVVGVDVDPNTVEYCIKSVKLSNVEFSLIDPEGKTNKALINKFDVIVSMETIEHVPNYSLFLNNLKKYLKKDKGTIIISTPNNYKNEYPPKNKFHIKEFGIVELYKILRSKFSDFEIEVYGQRKTTLKRDDEVLSDPITAKTLLVKFLQLIWTLDFKYLGLFRKIEHLNVYKRVGSIQREEKDNFRIYKINPSSNFFNPITSLYVIRKR